MDKEYLRKIGLSLAAAAKRGDEKAVAKWATKALVEVLPEPDPEPAVEAIRALEAGQELTGLTNWSAASVDAGFVVRASLGADEAELRTNPVPGAAKALGFCGVVGTGTGPDILYATFVDGVMGEASPINPGDGPDGYTVRFGLAAGVDPDALYVG